MNSKTNEDSLKQEVSKFYNQIGWQMQDDGFYQNARYEDLRPVSHVVGAQKMSKFEFGRALARKFGFDPELVQPASVLDGGLTAARSPNLTLNTGKIVAAIGHPLPDFETGLQKFYDQYRHGFPELLKNLA